MSNTDKSKLDGATSSATASKLIIRDSSGRARIVNPSNELDIANKGYVDGVVSAHKSGSEEHTEATPTQSGFMSAADKTKLDNATSVNTASRLMIRDASGRARVSNPSSSTDIANKAYVDSQITASIQNIVTGTYTGDGASTKSISLGFKPRAVFVYPVGVTPTYQYAGLAVQGQNAVVSTSYKDTYATDYSYHYVTVMITDTGFDVSYCSSSSHTRTNYSGYKYNYIAIK